LLDASNGVGGKWVNKFVENMKNLFAVTVINSDDLNHLNNNCGAEHVHKAEPSKKFPRGAREAFEHLGKLEKIRALSFDGDADRIIY
jgi:phosphomannomutase